MTGLASPSLFGGTTVIVVRDVGDAAEAVADELKRVLAGPLDDIVLVLVHPGGTKGKSLLDAARAAGAVVVECKAVKWESDKVAFVQAEFKAAGRRVAPDAAVALVDAVGSDLRELASACAQLVADTSGTVDRAMVERYHAGRVEVTGFKVADAAVEGRYEEALRLLRHALATGVDPVPVNAAFAAGLRTLAKVAGASRSARPDDVARDLGLAPFQVKKARGQLGGWTPGRRVRGDRRGGPCRRADQGRRHRPGVRPGASGRRESSRPARSAEPPSAGPGDDEGRHPHG